MKRIVFIAALLLSATCMWAQEDVDDVTTLGGPETFGYKLKNQIYRYPKPIVERGDTMWCYLLPEIWVYPPIQFKSEKQRRQYNRLVYNVKRVLPLAQKVNLMISETYQVLEQLPDKKSKEEHMKAVEKEIKNTYTPEMKKLTYSQGKLLIKLIDREIGRSSYKIIRDYKNGITAGFWQGVAKIFGNDLKKGYDPNGEDRVTEYLVSQWESGEFDNLYYSIFWEMPEHPVIASKRIQFED